MDLTKDGNKYIVVYIEYLTKWVDAEVVPNKNAATVISSLVKFVCTHGIRNTLKRTRADNSVMNGTSYFVKKWEYITKLRLHITHKLEVKQNVSSVLFLTLVSVVNKTCNDWDLKLPYVLFAYRTTELSTKKQEPFFLVNATRSAGKREKEPEVTVTSHQEDSKLRWKKCGQNNPEYETFLSPKKRKNLEVLESSMYILYLNNHYQPVLDVVDCKFQDLFSRPPYLPVRKYVPEKYWKYDSAQTIEAALASNYNDEKILQEMREYPATVYVQKYKETHYNISGTEDAVKEFDPNVFNLLSDHENFVDLLF
ncbi:hypothetical protein CHS0354_031154 [Potamilus streckersoni]|uniref:Integrase catalytic domain-containing protein n=1 Tax=Potamilus streckersoni TaxID=2493646 RepID=A0AAE0TLH1_9BIVA|nr:hypothetical protein CHS0354_031154 [Potamilus streckersoni]